MTDTEYLDEFYSEFWRTLQKDGISAMSRLQRDALCILKFEAAMMGDGMEQYLLNSSGDLARETPDVLRRIGADEVAAVLERANSYFGPAGPPTSREQRVEQLLALPEDKQQEIDDLTEQFYDAEDPEHRLADLLEAYVLSQRST